MASRLWHQRFWHRPVLDRNPAARALTSTGFGSGRLAPRPGAGAATGLRDGMLAAAAASRPSRTSATDGGRPAGTAHWRRWRTTAATASRPATMSFGLCSRMRITRPRSSSASIAAACALRRRRRGMSSSSSIRLGTFLHLMGQSWSIFGLGIVRIAAPASASRYCLMPPMAARRPAASATVTVVPSPSLLCTLISPSCKPTRPFTIDRPRPVPSCRRSIGLAGLEERIADPLEVVGGDADAGIGDTQHQPRSLDRGRDGHAAAALGELDGVGDEVQRDLLERARIAGHHGQILRRAGDEIDAVFPRLQRQQVAAIAAAPRAARTAPAKFRNCRIPSWTCRGCR